MIDADILGKRIRLSADDGEDDRYLSAIIAHYRTLIETVQRTTSASAEHTAILAGLMAVDEYYKLHKQTQELAAPAQPRDPHPHNAAPTDSHTADAPLPDYAHPLPNRDEAQDITDSILNKIDEIF